MEMRKSRVLVVAAGLFFGLMCLWMRIGWLQVVRSDYYRARAERNHAQRVLVRAARGDLLDRRGRPLARDLPSYSISAAPREMENPRATARDLARLLDLDSRKLERRFAARPRFLWVTRRLPPDVGQQVAAWKRRGLYLALETRREYALGPVASEIVGRTNIDHVGVEGLELQMDEALRGRPGWATLFRDGRGRAHDLDRGMKRSPQDGHDVVLTLDAELQAIVENHLRRAVDTLKAVRGFALFIDPRTGEVLASVNVPHLPPGRGRNWTFTDQFEPGSTFKIVVASAALEDNVASPEQYFEASATGVANVAPGIVFHDVHRQEGYTFYDALRWSSNIVMGKLGIEVGAERLYRFATQFGFGSLTGVRFPGEASGRLRSPDAWSSRSCPTIAIGHEISVTELQMALAYGAIANGGLLMQPMLVREIRDAEGNSVERFSPNATHRVLGEGTARRMRGMLTAVVDSGTAHAAHIPDLDIAGKTGTAQKYDAAVGTYGRGKYLSSFVGFVPAEAPRLLGVVVIDEPRSGHYYGGEVAAPLFRRVIEDVRRLPHGPLDVGSTRVAAAPPEPAPVIVPDLRLLLPPAAKERLAEYGLRVRLRGQGRRVLAQEPPAGRAVERGASVTAWLSAPDDSNGTRLPDLTGMPLREALRRLARLEVRVRIDGMGVVTSQWPKPGTRLPLEGACRLRCESVLASAALDRDPANASGSPGPASDGTRKREAE